MKVSVKLGQACNGDTGYIEQDTALLSDDRVFEFLDNGKTQWRYFDDWHAYGNKARVFGSYLEVTDFVVG
jgi:hypothetical protein